MPFASKHLRCKIRKRPTEAIGRDIVQYALLTQPKVRQLDMAILLNDDVIWLQVSEDDLSLVQVLDCQDNLGDVDFGEAFVDLALLLYELSEVAARAIVEDEIQPILRLKCVIKLHYERMMSIRQHISLGHRVFDVVVAHYLQFAQHFHSV